MSVSHRPQLGDFLTFLIRDRGETAWVAGAGEGALYDGINVNGNGRARRAGDLRSRPGQHKQIDGLCAAGESAQWRQVANGDKKGPHTFLTLKSEPRRCVAFVTARPPALITLTQGPPGPRTPIYNANRSFTKTSLFLLFMNGHLSALLRTTATRQPPPSTAAARLSTNRESLPLLHHLHCFPSPTKNALGSLLLKFNISRTPHLSFRFPRCISRFFTFMFYNVAFFMIADKCITELKSSYFRYDRDKKCRFMDKNVETCRPFPPSCVWYTRFKSHDS